MMILREAPTMFRSRCFPLVLVGLVLAPFAARSAEPSPTAADEETLKRAALATDDANLVKFFRDRTLSDDVRRTIVETIAKLGDDSYAVREQATETLRGKGLTAASLLKQAARTPDADVELVKRAEKLLETLKIPDATTSAAAARLLAAHKSAETVPTLLAFLPFSDDESLTEELRLALVPVAVRDGKPDPVLVKALHDPLPIKRGAAGAALGQAGAPGEREEVHKLLQDSDPQVRLATGLGLVRGRDKAAMPVLITLLGELPAEHAWRVEDVLCRLAGDQSPNVALGSDQAARARCRDAWSDWWKKNGETADLAKLDATPPLLGYTLLVQMSPQNGLGKVYEIDAQKKSRWSIDNLNYPVDAHMVRNDRVLIVEYNGQQVTERDTTKGDIVWQFQIQQPICAERLPNGNTFVGCQGQLIVVDHDKKEVFRYNRPNNDIASVTRMRDGGFVFVTNIGTCVRLDATGKEVKSFQIGGRPRVFCGIEGMPDGKVLIPVMIGNKVMEYDADGKNTWSANFANATSASRLPNGNTLVASFNQQKVVELDNTGKSVWEFQSDGWVWRARRR